MKVLVSCYITYNAVNWYRGFGTYSHMAETYSTNEDLITWDKLNDIDCLVMIRPNNYDQVDSLNFAKSLGIKTVVDYDDDVFNSNPSSPAYEKTISKEWIECSIKSLKIADHVTVSTQAIADSFVKQGVDPAKIFIIPNAYNDYHRPFDPKPNLTDRIFIRGDHFAHPDILSQFESIRMISRMYKLVAMGEMQLFFPFFKFEECYQYLTPPFYFDSLPTLNCRAMMKPMLDTVFNRAKSNCSWIEATSAGMVLIAPNLPEFQRPGVVLTDHFFAGVKHVMEDDAYLEAFNLSKEYIKNNLLLSKVNELRENMLTQ